MRNYFVTQHDIFFAHCFQLFQVDQVAQEIYAHERNRIRKRTQTRSSSYHDMLRQLWLNFCAL